MMRMRAGFLVVLLCLVLVNCDGRDPSTNDFVGTWTMTDDAQLAFPAMHKQARGKIVLSKSGEFVSDDVPGEMLYSMPGMAPVVQISGTGTWKLGRVDGDLVLLLTFRTIRTQSDLKVPNGTQLLIDKGWHETVLYFFIGDPDGGKRVDFRKRK
jgi:hypothetical protein